MTVKAGKTTTLNLKWSAESAGKELWRIGTPDKTSGEFANGFERDLTKPNQPASASLISCLPIEKCSWW